jgi:hypothetical protein
MGQTHFAMFGQKHVLELFGYSPSPPPRPFLPRARIFKLLRSPRIGSEETIPLGYVAWRAGTPTLFLLGS